MAIHFINTTEAEFLKPQYIFKYMSLENGLLTMKNKNLWFANPTIWPDPFEKRFIEAQYKVGTTTRGFAWFDRVYCSCFTNVASNEAAWKVYTDKSLGIEFKINRQVLLDTLNQYAVSNPHHNVYIGFVEYKQTKDIVLSDITKIKFKNSPTGGYNSDAFKANLLLLKRKAFSYEKEIRIIIVRPKKSQVGGITVPFANCSSLFETVTLDPNMGDEITRILKKIIVQPQYLNCVGSVKRVVKSQIYAKVPKSTLKA